MADQELDIEQIQQALEELQEKFGISSDELTRFTKAVKKTAADFNKEISSLNKEIAKGKQGYKDQLAMLDQLDDAIDDLTESANKEQNATKKLVAEQNRAALLTQRDALQTSASMQGLQESVKSASKEIGLTLAKGAGTFAKGLQSNAASTELSASLMNAGVDAATIGVKGFGSGLQAVAPALMLVPGPAKLVGGALMFLGGALNQTADAFGKLVKFGIEVSQKEVEKTAKSFNTMNASGAMFTDGMTGMRNAAGDAGLTIEQFSGLVKDNSVAIAAAGLSMTDGAKFIGRTFKAGGDTMKRQMLNLGIGFDEQTALIAETMKDMRGVSSGPLKASEAQVAEQTMKYAENLRIIAAITGEDAKKKMQETRDQANQLMFQQKLAGMDEVQRQNVINAMANMSKQQQKDYMDMVNFGSIINKTGAVMASTMPSYAASIQESADLTKRGVLDDEKQRAINARHQERITREALSQTGIAAAGAAGRPGTANDIAPAIMDQLNFLRPLTKEATEAAEEQAKAAKDTADKFTESVVNAELAAQNLKIRVQDLMKIPIEKFSETSIKMLNAVEKLLEELFPGSVVKKPEPKKGTVEDYNKSRGRPSMRQTTETRNGLDDIKKLFAPTPEQVARREGKPAPAKPVEKAPAPASAPAKPVEKTTNTSKGLTLEQIRADPDYERYYKEALKFSPNDPQAAHRAAEMIINNETVPKYAEGGKIPAGQTGIVGEAGPEIVKGPADVTSAKDSKEILDKLENLSVGQLASQAMDSMKMFASEEQGSIAGFFLQAADKLKWSGDKNSGLWTMDGQVVDQNVAREILDFASNWPKMKQEIQADLEKAREMLGKDGSKLDAAFKDIGVSSKITDYATGFAKGGIASGTLSGYSATLHGTEAVVPLPDNKSIPVNLEGSAITSALQAQSDILNSILSAMQQNNRYASGLLQNSY